MKVLGISAFYHDSAAALVIDGEIVSAAQEERFTRIKHDSTFPHQAIDFCLKSQNLGLGQIDYVTFYEKPFLKFERLLETYMAFAPRGFSSFAKSLPSWVKEKLFQKKIIKEELERKYPKFDWENRLLFSEHHHSHGASAFYPSPFQEAIVLTMDGVGEWTTTRASVGSGNSLEIFKEIHFPHSIGLLYSAFTYFCGFKVNSGEYKLMGLAPYGRPRYVDKIKESIVDIKDDGSFRLNMKYFNYCTGLTMTSKHFAQLFELPVRRSSDPITQEYMDLAASIQKVTEEIVVKLVQSLVEETKIRNVCLAGGVALNCVANGKINEQLEGINLWIQPAAGDAGGAIGAALLTTYLFGRRARKIKPTQDGMKGSFLGPAYTQEEVEQALESQGAHFKVLSEDEMLEKAAQYIADEKVVGWFQGRMEFGPRALGGRSILADPRSPNMQKNLNLKIKFRESFRPFAPSVLEGKAEQWFNLKTQSPYMLLVADVKEEKLNLISEEDRDLIGIEKLQVSRSQVPAITHVDNSARIQTVSPDVNPLFFQLLSKFEENTDCPLVINTSFNVRGEPIVCTPQDAFRCFMGTDMDVLVIGRCILEKSKQTSELLENYSSKFEMD